MCRPGRKLTLNCVTAQVPLNDRPGPLRGRLGSVSSSSRTAVIFASCDVPTIRCGVRACTRRAMIDH